MPLKEKPHKGGRRFRFMSRRKTQGEDFNRDSGDLVQMAVIVAALVVASIVVVGGVSSVTQSKGKSTAECINNSTGFGQGAVVRENCKKSDVEAQEKGGEAIDGNFGGSNPTGGNETEGFRKPNPDECFVLDGETIIGYKITEEQCNSDVVIPNEIDGQKITRIEYRAPGEEALNEAMTKHKDYDRIMELQRRYIAGEVSIDEYYEEVTVFLQEVSKTLNVAFSGIGITGVNFNEHIEFIGAKSFSQSNLGKVVLPKTIKHIGEEAFQMSGIKGTLTIPETIETIQEGSFSHNEISDLKIKSGINAIGNSAFILNKQPMKVEIPGSVQSVGDRAFYSSNVTDINIGDGVETIGRDTFQLNNIKTLHLPNSIKDIGTGAFSSNELVELTLPENEFYTNINSRTFAGCSTLCGGLNPANPPRFTKIKNLTIPSNIDMVGLSAFEYTEIENLTFEKGSTTTWYSAFHKSKIGTLTFSAGSGDVDLFRKTSGVGDGFGGTIIDTVIIPEHVKYIGKASFRNANIGEVIFSEGLETIDSSAFYKAGLESISLPHSLKNINNFAFSENNLKTIEFHEGLETVKVSAFSGNANLNVDGLKIPYSIKEMQNTSVRGGLENSPTIYFPTNKTVNKLAFPKTANIVKY